MNKYGVIIADPPWAYRVNKDTPYNHGVANAQYDTMVDSAIGDLELEPGVRVADVALDDSVLLMWTTNPKLVEGLETMKAWGFSYVTKLEWVKTQPGIPLVAEPTLIDPPEWSFKPAYGVGFWLRGVTEPILIGKRGKPRIPKAAGICGIICERMRHSRKPDNLHAYAELMDGPYLELFARRQRPGWDVWGNQV